MSKAGDNPLNGLHIKGARHFDIDKVFSDKNSELPHTMLSPEDFQKAAQSIGINQKDTIVVYDNLGVYASPRAWWMFRSMGHEEVYVLDGGLPLWQEKGLPIEGKLVAPTQKGNFVSNPVASYFVNSQDVLAGIDDDQITTLDARSEGRFYGTAPEPREGLRSGHIPNSKSLPFPSLMDGWNMKNQNELAEEFDKLQIDKSNSMYCSCGSGLTACIIALGATVAGFENISVYDGSWSEWGLPGKLPVSTT